VQSARAFLSQTATRLCLDRLTSAQARREQYVGVWLPEPLVDEAMDFHPGPDVITEYAQDVSIAFMLALERLSPLERAAFLLHDVFAVTLRPSRRHGDPDAGDAARHAGTHRVDLRDAQPAQARTPAAAALTHCCSAPLKFPVFARTPAKGSSPQRSVMNLRIDVVS